MIVSIFVIVGLLTESRRSDSCKDESALRPIGRVFFLQLDSAIRKYEWSRYNFVLTILLLIVKFRNKKC